MLAGDLFPSPLWGGVAPKAPGWAAINGEARLMAQGESGKRQGETPLGYGHDGKGAALGDAVNEGRVHVAPPPRRRTLG